LSEEGISLRGHTADISALAFNGDRQIATASLDGTIRIWNLGSPVIRPDKNWRESIGDLRSSTNACLTTEQRVRLLSETKIDARKQNEDCEKHYGRTGLPAQHETRH
jgi:WD40 repeat protein